MLVAQQLAPNQVPYTFYTPNTTVHDIALHFAANTRKFTLHIINTGKLIIKPHAPVVIQY
jgi:hypothetical protein